MVSEESIYIHDFSYFTKKNLLLLQLIHNVYFVFW